MPDTPYPYEQRVKVLSQGYSMIWPFSNAPPKTGPYELFLDNNALTDPRWVQELEPEFRANATVNLTLALAEQWLSNPLFRADAQNRIEAFIAPFTQAGFRFSADFAPTQVATLIRNQAAWRTQWMLMCCYIALLYRITKAKKTDPLPDALLMGLKHQQVPMFNASIMLCALASYLRRHQFLHPAGDTQTAFSYLDRFISSQPSGKNEERFDEAFLRNRAGDLTLWYLVGTLRQLKFQAAGESVIVTRDKPLSKLIFRCFPSYLQREGHPMGFGFDEGAFEPQHAAKINELLHSVTGQWQPPTDRAEQFRRMETLRIYVTQGAEPQLKAAVDAACGQWLVPGYFDSFQ